MSNFKSVKTLENWLKQGKAIYLDRLGETMRYTLRANGIWCSMVEYPDTQEKSIYQKIEDLFKDNPRKYK